MHKDADAIRRWPPSRAGANQRAPKVRGPNSAQPMVRHKLGRSCPLHSGVRCCCFTVRRQPSSAQVLATNTTLPLLLPSQNVDNTTSPACFTLANSTSGLHAHPSRNIEHTARSSSTPTRLAPLA